MADGTNDHELGPADVFGILLGATALTIFVFWLASSLENREIPHPPSELKELVSSFWGFLTSTLAGGASLAVWVVKGRSNGATYLRWILGIFIGLVVIVTLLAAAMKNNILHPVPEPTVTAQVQPPATPLPQIECKQIGWGRPSGGPVPGCGCGTATVAIEPTLIRGIVGQTVRLNWEANPLCRGQSIKDSDNFVEWGDGSGRLPISDVCLDHKYSRPGDYRITVVAKGTCYDYGAANCSNLCEASGWIVAEIR